MTLVHLLQSKYVLPRLHDTVTVRFGLLGANQPGAGSGAD